MIVACAWCRKVLSPDVEESADRLASADVTHTICPACRVIYFAHLLEPAVQAPAETLAAIRTVRAPSGRRRRRRSSTVRRSRIV